MTIRRVPSDFVVEEQLDPAFRAAVGDHGGGRKYALYRVTKTSRTTQEVVSGLARVLGLKLGGVHWGGLKDKHAETIQHLTADVAQAPQAVPGQGWSAELLGWVDQPMWPTLIRGNQFRIVVRDLSRGAAEAMEERARALTPEGASGRLLVVNYFGDQRFGSARHGEGFAAARLIRGDFEGALKLLIATPARKDSGKRRTFTRLLAEEWGKWDEVMLRLPRFPERKAVEALAKGKDFREAFEALPFQLQNLCVEAFQSYLWNGAVRRMARALPGAWGVDDAYGEMVFVPAAAVPEAWMGMQIPLMSRLTPLREPWGGAMKEAMAEEGIASPEELAIPGLRRPRFDAHARRVVVAAEGFVLGPIEADEMSGGKRVKRRVEMGLPSGAFGTVVLRALGQ